MEYFRLFGHISALLSSAAALEDNQHNLPICVSTLSLDGRGETVHSLYFMEPVVGYLFEVGSRSHPELGQVMRTCTGILLNQMIHSLCSACPFARLISVI